VKDEDLSRYVLCACSVYPAGTPADRPREVVQLFSGGRFRRSPVTDYRRAGSNTDESLENILRQAPSGGYPDLLLARPLDFLSIFLRALTSLPFLAGTSILNSWAISMSFPAAVPSSAKSSALPATLTSQITAFPGRGVVSGIRRRPWHTHAWTRGSSASEVTTLRLETAGAMRPFFL